MGFKMSSVIRGEKLGHYLTRVGDSSYYGGSWIQLPANKLPVMFFREYRYLLESASIICSEKEWNLYNLPEDWGCIGVRSAVFLFVDIKELVNSAGLDFVKYVKDNKLI